MHSQTPADCRPLHHCDRDPDRFALLHKQYRTVIVTAVKLFLINMIIAPTDIALKSIAQKRLFRQIQKIALVPDLQMGISPTVPIHHEGIPRLRARILDPDLALLRQILHWLLFIDLKKKFFYIMFIAWHSRKSFVGRIMLPVMSGENLLKLRTVEKPDSLLPVTSGQIRKMKEIPDLSQTGADLILQHVHLKRQVIFPSVRDDIKEAVYLFSGLHSRRVKPVTDLVLTARKLTGDTLHAQIRSRHMAFRHQSLRPVHEKRPLAGRFCLKGQRNSRTGEIQRTVLNMKFTV